MLELITNADVHAPEPLGRRHLLVAAGRIVWMGEDLPEVGAELLSGRVDLAGRRLIPGLLDGHVHVTGGGGEAGYGSSVPAPPLSAYGRGGVTTAVGLLGTDDTVRTPAEVLAAVRGLRRQGLSAWCYTGGYHVPPATVTGSVRGDIVHLGPVLGVGELALSDHRSSQATGDELLRVAADAHVAGLMTGKAGIVHLHMGDGPRGLELVRRALEQSELPPRVFQPTHVNRRRGLFDEALELARAVGLPVDLTAFPVAEDEDAWSAEEGLARYLDSGAPADRVTVSSDAGGCLPVFDDEGRVAAMDVGRPGALLTTLGRLLAAGWPLERVLPAFTVNVARQLRLSAKGRIAVGADADLVVLGEAEGSGDALRPDRVMARGRWLLVDGEPVARGPFEDAWSGRP